MLLSVSSLENVWVLVSESDFLQFSYTIHEYYTFSVNLGSQDHYWQLFRVMYMLLGLGVIQNYLTGIHKLMQLHFEKTHLPVPDTFTINLDKSRPKMIASTISI